RRFGMVAVSYAYDLARPCVGAAGERKHIKQPPRTEQRVNPGLLHLAQHGHALGRIFLGENRNLRFGEKATCHQFLGDQVLRRSGRESRDMHRTKEVQRDVACLVDPHFLIGFRHAQHAHFEQIAAPNQQHGPGGWLRWASLRLGLGSRHRRRQGWNGCALRPSWSDRGQRQDGRQYKRKIEPVDCELPHGCPYPYSSVRISVAASTQPSPPFGRRPACNQTTLTYGLRFQIWRFRIPVTRWWEDSCGTARSCRAESDSSPSAIVRLTYGSSGPARVRWRWHSAPPRL